MNTEHPSPPASANLRPAALSATAAGNLTQQLRNHRQALRTRLSLLLKADATQEIQMTSQTQPMASLSACMMLHL
jgi:hypothetical protein